MRTSPPTTTVPVRSLMTTRATASVSTGSGSSRAIRSGTGAAVLAGHLAPPRVPGRPRARRPAPSSALIASASARGAHEVGLAQRERDACRSSASVRRLPTCTSPPPGTRPDRQVIHLHAVAAAAAAESAERQRALRRARRPRRPGRAAASAGACRPAGCARRRPTTPSRRGARPAARTAAVRPSRAPPRRSRS